MTDLPTVDYNSQASQQGHSQRQQPPAYGSSARDAINSIVDSLTINAASRIASLRRELDELEQAMLTNASNTKAALRSHVDVMGSVQAEISRVSDVVGAIREDQSFFGERTN